MIATQPVVQPEGKKLRRKLQKITGRIQQPTSPATVKPPTVSWLRRSLSDQRRTSIDKAVVRTQPDKPPLLPPDLSDDKWLDYVRKSSYVGQPMLKEPMVLATKIIPELAHLSISDTPPRKSSDSNSTNSKSSTSTPHSSLSARRRYAKTPIHSIGQLERARAREPVPLKHISGIESIAESYRALLSSPKSILTEDYSGRPPSLYEDAQEHYRGGQSSPDDNPPQFAIATPLTRKLGMGSPVTSDDGTLVDFEEDVIYFKPVSFDEDPPSPLRSLRARESTLTAATVENPSLQICMDLLNKELSSAVSGNPHRPRDETSALQIWVMIEAYEKLRNQVLASTQDSGQAKCLETMFDMWLSALHKAHDRMDGTDDQRSVSDYGDSPSMN